MALVPARTRLVPATTNCLGTAGVAAGTGSAPPAGSRDGRLPRCFPGARANQAVHRKSFLGLERQAYRAGLRSVHAVTADRPAPMRHLMLPGQHDLGVLAAVVPGVAVRIG